jgi:hypothetical protein
MPVKALSASGLGIKKRNISYEAYLYSQPALLLPSKNLTPTALPGKW